MDSMTPFPFEILSLSINAFLSVFVLSIRTFWDPWLLGPAFRFFLFFLSLLMFVLFIRSGTCAYSGLLAIHMTFIPSAETEVQAHAEMRFKPAKNERYKSAKQYTAQNRNRHGRQMYLLSNFLEPPVSTRNVRHWFRKETKLVWPWSPWLHFISFWRWLYPELW